MIENANIILSSLQDQYRFLYDMATEYMDSFDAYANFKWHQSPTEDTSWTITIRKCPLVGDRGTGWVGSIKPGASDSGEVSE